MCREFTGLVSCLPCTEPGLPTQGSSGSLCFPPPSWFTQALVQVWEDACHPLPELCCKSPCPPPRFPGRDTTNTGPRGWSWAPWEGG